MRSSRLLAPLSRSRNRFLHIGQMDTRLPCSNDRLFCQTGPDLPRTHRLRLRCLETNHKRNAALHRALSRALWFHVQELVSASLLTIALHDVGKMIAPFQEMMETVRAGASYDTRRNYRHELVSFLYVASQREHLKDSCAPLILLGALAVAGHHRSLNSDLTSFERERMATKRRDPPPYQLPAGIHEALDVAEELFELEGAHMHISDEERLRHADPYANVEAMVPYVHTYKSCSRGWSGHASYTPCSRGSYTTLIGTDRAWRRSTTRLRPDPRRSPVRSASGARPRVTRIVASRRFSARVASATVTSY